MTPPAAELVSQLPFVRVAIATIAPKAEPPRFDDESGAMLAAGYEVYRADDGKFMIGREVLVPGVRYYRDGSGEPDSSDFVDVAEVLDVRKLAPQLAQLVAADTINAAIEAEAERWYAEQAEAAEAEADAAEGDYEQRLASYYRGRV